MVNLVKDGFIREHILLCVILSQKILYLQVMMCKGFHPHFCSPAVIASYKYSFCKKLEDIFSQKLFCVNKLCKK